ncbi:MAG: GTP-binding protein [Myxococcota bacterium]
MTFAATDTGADPEGDRQKMNIVIVGHVDHGKSTLVGRLLADTGSLPDGKLEAVRAICERQGKAFEYAFLLDALEAERDQGITIDSARCFFKTDRRDYIVIDAPGHIEFLKNMISGAARAEAALLLIDAHEGVRENSRRHGYVLGLLGIRQVTVLVNKMDLVGWSQEVFERIEEEYRAFLLECGLVPMRFIPISARDGDNVAHRSTQAPWFRGPTVLESVDLFQKAASRAEAPLRFPVQDVYKWNREGDERRIIAGRLESGRVSVGDQLLFSPSMKVSTVASIEAFNVNPLPQTMAWPDSLGVTLREQIFVARGEIVSLLSDPPSVSARFRANVVWLGREPLTLGKSYKLKLTTVEIACKVAEIRKVLDASTLAAETDRKEIRRHEVAEVVLEARRPIAFDTVDRFEATGRFVLVDGWDLAGGGIILEALSDSLERQREEARIRSFEWEEGLVDADDRQARWGHKAALVLLTGGANVGKAAIARALEKAWFDAGLLGYRLDGKNVYLGVDSGIVGDRHEVVRRYAEVAYLFLDAGHLLVSTSNTFGLADHQVMRTLVTPHPVLHVHVGHADEASEADLVLAPSGREPSPDALVAAVTAVSALLAERGVVPSEAGHGRAQA